MASIKEKFLMPHMIGLIIAWTLICLTIWAIVAAIIDIHKKIGLCSNCGFFWMLAVIAGSLLGVILYRFSGTKLKIFVKTCLNLSRLPLTKFTLIPDPFAATSAALDSEFCLLNSVS